MFDFGGVVYLDMQKTGSTSVIGFLKAHLTPDLVESSRHGRLKRVLGPETFCFTSVRAPIAQYVSLYRFGGAAKGGLYRRLAEQGLADRLYGRGAAGFHDWAAFVLDPANARHLDPGYVTTTPELFGLMSFRLLFQALPRPLRALRHIESRDQLRKTYGAGSVIRGFIRTEQLSQDLARLCDGGLAPYLRDREAALAQLREDIRANVSTSPNLSDMEISPALKRQIIAREWFLHETFGPMRGGDPMQASSPQVQPPNA